MRTSSSFRDHAASILLAASVFAAILPTYVRLAEQTWRTDEGGHGPLIAAAVLWLCWLDRSRYAAVARAPAPEAGWAVLALGIVMLVIGRSQGFLSVEVAAQISIAAGCILLMRGWPLLRAGVFPLFFLVFLIPLPGSLVDAVTVPLKTFISDIVVEVLYRAGLPVAQSGVVIMIGPYQLLVKDACAGMNSIFTLSAIGLLYLRLHNDATALRKIILTAAILPIAIGANLVRVMCLVLIAYFDDLDAIEGYYHDMTGIFLFVVALGMLLGVDTAINAASAVKRWIVPTRNRAPLVRDQAA